MPTTYEIVGSRCGNGILESGETCEAMDRLDGDCCSSSCTLDPAGTACGGDANVCTDDVCDGAGTCEHPFNTDPCEEIFGCGTGNCANGACVVSAPEPIGTSCNIDDNVCTLDSCDGAGACAVGGTLDCAPCGVCDAGSGCVLADTTSCQEPHRIEAKLALGGRGRVDVHFEVSHAPGLAATRSNPGTRASAAPSFDLAS